MTMMRRGLGVALLATVCSSVHAQEVTIERIAPESTFMVAGVKNASQFCGNLKDSALWKLWTDGPVASFLEQSSGVTRDEMLKELDELLSEFGMSREEIPWPTGAAGSALFSLDDEQTGMPNPAMIMFADFGDNAEAFDQLFDRILDEGVKNDALSYETKEFAGRTIYVLEPSEKARRLAEQLDPGMPRPGGGMGGPPIPVPDVEDLIGEFERLHLVRNGSSWLASSHEQQLVDTLEMLDADRATEFALRDAVRGSMRQLGDQNAYGMFFVQPLLRMIAATEPMVMMMQPMVASFVGDVHAVGFGLKMDELSGSMNLTTNVFMPNGTMGLSSLLDRNMPMTAPPTFIGPDTINYATMSVDFPGLLDVLAQVMAMVPMMGAEGDQVAQEMEMTVGPMLRALGTQIHSSTTLTRPATVENSGGVIAIECRNEQDFETGFSRISLDFGMQPRDFLGHRIYSMDLGMMGMPQGSVPDSVGIGAGHVFIGTSQAVEQALRVAGQEEVPSVVGEPLYQRARAAIGDNTYVGWGFINVVDMIQLTIQQQIHNQEMMIEGLRTWDPEMADEMAVDVMAMSEMYQSFDFQELRDHLGPVIWSLRSEQSGFVMKGSLLPAVEE